ncbi:MAG: phosphotransferase [bacterium]|nr:phosphotransferase [bacterium]
MPPERALRAFESAGALVAPTAATAITTGLLNETYAVEDAKGRSFILQRVNPIFDRAINDNLLAITNHLAARGVKTFRVCPIDGNPAVDLAPDGLWRLLTHVEGLSHDQPQDVEQVLAAGRAVADFHRALFDFDEILHPLGFPFHDTRHYFEDLTLAVRECLDHPFQREISRLANDILDAASQLEFFEDLPHRVIHGDLKFNNLLFAPRTPGHAPTVTGIIDLDTVCRMPLAYDWGDAMRSWCNRRAEDEPEAELDLEYAATAARGLRTAFEVPPAVSELDSLCRSLEVVSLELCARFATDTLRECYFAWDRSRFERAAEHNRRRASGQLSLFRQARATRDERAPAIRG